MSQNNIESKDIFDKKFNLIEKIDNTSNINNERNNSNKDFTNERCKMKLFLRKKKMNEKIFNKRKKEAHSLLYPRIHREKFIMLNESFINLISKIQTEYKDEKKLLILLNKISYIIEQKYNDKNTEIVHEIFNFTTDDLINNNWAYNLCNLSKIYFKSPNVIEFISRIFLNSCLLINNDLENEENNILYDEKETLNRSAYFISSDRYIDVYNKILSLYLNKNFTISVNMINFIGQIAKNEKSNQLSLYVGGTMKLILDSINTEKTEDKLLKEKIWCLSKFEVEKLYETNLELVLKIQNIYIDIYQNKEKYELFNDINEEVDDNNFLYNYLKLIENSVGCIENIVVENLIKSNLIEFLIDNFINKDIEFNNIIIKILINLSNSEYNLCKRLINIGVIKYLKNIIKDKTLPVIIREIAFYPINNFIYDLQLCNLVMFEQKVFQLSYDILSNDEDLEPLIFKEILTGFDELVIKNQNSILSQLINKYKIIQLICKRMKKIMNLKIYLEVLDKFCNFFIALMDNNDNDLINQIIIIFQNSEGEEILDKILIFVSKISSDEIDKEDANLISNITAMSEIIKDKIKDI